MNIKCDEPGVCLGETQNGCAEGHAGILCKRCSPGYTRSSKMGSGGLCEKCFSLGSTRALITLGAFISVAVVVYLIHTTVNSENGKKRLISEIAK